MPAPPAYPLPPLLLFRKETKPCCHPSLPTPRHGADLYHGRCPGRRLDWRLVHLFTQQYPNDFHALLLVRRFGGNGAGLHRPRPESWPHRPFGPARRSPPEAVVTTPVAKDAKGQPVAAGTPPGTAPAASTSNTVPVTAATVGTNAQQPVPAQR